MRFAPLFALFLSGTALAADATKPHDHQGIVAAYTGAPPPVALSAEDLGKLAAGELVTKQVQRGNGGHGVAFQDIKATPDTIWARINNHAMYPSWVNGVKSCQDYKKEGAHVWTAFGLSVLGVNVDYFINHTFVPAQNYLTWTLDYTRQSDLDDSVGYWRIIPLSTTPVLTRVEYSVDIRFKGWIPGFAQDFIANKGLTDAVSWVKKQSEAG